MSISTNCVLPMISSDSTKFFCVQSPHVPDFLYHAICIGHYYCNSTYKINRINYDSFLMIYTKNGNGIIEIDGISHQASPGDICLIDCYKPHSYRSLNEWEILWFHFDGNNSRSFFEYLCDGEPFFHILPQHPTHFEITWEQLYAILSQRVQPNQFIISQYISQSLTLLALSCTHKLNTENYSDFINSSLKYIHHHLSEEITVEILAKRVSLSPYYFLRKFKEEIGYTPYRYILISRIHLAEFLLKTSTDSIKIIAYQCGFHTEHSFCTSFKKETNMTPTEYRNHAH